MGSVDTMLKSMGIVSVIGFSIIILSIIIFQNKVIDNMSFRKGTTIFILSLVGIPALLTLLNYI